MSTEQYINIIVAISTKTMNQYIVVIRQVTCNGIDRFSKITRLLKMEQKKTSCVVKEISRPEAIYNFIWLTLMKISKQLYELL